VHAPRSPATCHSPDVARDALRPIGAALLAALWMFALGFAH
jgi:hypothetical protein